MTKKTAVDPVHTKSKGPESPTDNKKDTAPKRSTLPLILAAGAAIAGAGYFALSQSNSISPLPTVIQSTSNVARADEEIKTVTPSSLELEIRQLSPNRMHGEFAVNADGSPVFPVKAPPPADANVARLLREGGGFNIAKSNSISLDRDVSESRDEFCRTVGFDYSRMIPTTVVIVFHNESPSTLFRSIHSVLNRTPPQLLSEIILVDDKSTLPWIRTIEDGGSGELEEYLSHLPKVSLFRQPERMGLVAARLRGIKEVSKSKTFVILDSHIEVQHKWVEPLLERLGDGSDAESKKRFVMPQIDGIDAKTFTHTQGGIGCSLGFIWRLMEHAVPDQQHALAKRQGPSGPLESPAMAGGLFGAHKDYFYELGGYDEGMTYWGAENLEISFRIWQCGGTLECVPCSRVFHVFREGGAAYSVAPNAYTINRLRAMAVWMDDYQELVKLVMGYPQLDYGDVSSRVALREQLKCKPFDSFLKEVWPEGYVTDKSQVPYAGLVRNLGASNMVPLENKDLSVDGEGVCLQPNGGPDGGRVTAAPCQGKTAFTDRRWAGQGLLFFSKPGHWMPVYDDEACIAMVPQSGDRVALQMEWCDHKPHRWHYDPETHVMAFTKSKKIPTNKLFAVNAAKNKWMGWTCLALGENGALLGVPCDANAENQKWAMTPFDFKPRVFPDDERV